jgi:hypothetical protein
MSPPNYFQPMEDCELELAWRCAKRKAQLKQIVLFTALAHYGEVPLRVLRSAETSTV